MVQRPPSVSGVATYICGTSTGAMDIGEKAVVCPDVVIHTLATVSVRTNVTVAGHLCMKV